VHVHRSLSVAARNGFVEPILTTEAIIIAVGGAVVEDDGQGAEEEGAEVVDAAAFPEAIGRVAQAAHGLVVPDVRSADDHDAGANIDTAAQAVASNVTITSEGPVVLDGAFENGRRAAGNTKAASQGVPAVGHARAVAAERTTQRGRDRYTSLTRTRRTAVRLGVRLACQIGMVQSRVTAVGGKFSTRRLKTCRPNLCHPKWAGFEPSRFFNHFAAIAAMLPSSLM
jgi:hypothetical protein